MQIYTLMTMINEIIECLNGGTWIVWKASYLKNDYLNQEKEKNI